MSHHLAEVNLGRLRYARDSPAVAEFVAAIDQINALAERAPGFVWRLKTDRPFGLPDPAGDPRLLLNVSVWETYQHLHEFTYRSAHGRYLRRRAEWFELIETPATALWWVPVGAHPTPDEALERLRCLRRYGPTPRAFTVRRRFDPTGRPD